jgi:hypothetical protein
MVRAAARSGYARAAGGGQRYFLDKTPKYHIVVRDISRIFPDSPAVILWRNPLSVIASLMSTWGGGGGRWNIHHFRLDLYRGLPELIEATLEHPERFHTVHYERLVTQPDGVSDDLFAYLDLRPTEAGVDRFADVTLDGRVQDPNVGSEGFRTVRSDRIATWESVLSNPMRKAWCRRYLRWLGAERLAVMGYDLDVLLEDLDGVPTSRRFVASDVLLMPYDVAYRTLELSMMGRKMSAIRNGELPLLAYK